MTRTELVKAEAMVPDMAYLFAGSLDISQDILYGEVVCPWCQSSWPSPIDATQRPLCLQCTCRHWSSSEPAAAAAVSEPGNRG